MIELMVVAVFALFLAGGGIALRFAQAAATADTADEAPFSQRDTLPGSAPPTWRSSELGREFGEQPAQAEDPWL